MKFEYPQYIPVRVSLLPATWQKYRDDLAELVSRYPVIFEAKPSPKDYDDIRGTYVQGEHVDAWGCVWSNLHNGLEAIVTKHPVPTRADVHKLKAPEVDIGLPHGFMYLRLLDLRGFEEMMVDFAEEPPELQMLIDVVLEYNMRQLRRLLAPRSEQGTIMGFGDDLGMQDRLPISPEKWRKYLKPCYARLYGVCREAGHYVYMHSDGHILEIIPDLIGCGVNVINPQVRANGIDGLAEVCKGKVCVDLDLDRQMFPFCSPDHIDEHIREAVAKLGSPEGGLWLIAECGPDVPLCNIEAICQSLMRYRSYFSE